MKFPFYFLVLFYFFSQSVFAFSNNANTLTLKLINHSSQTLSYTGPIKTNPSNIFSITSTDLLPGGSAVITGTTTPYFDLIGELQFKDNDAKNNLLIIIDYRQIHIGQSVFSMNNSRLTSFVNSKIFNKNQGPLSLMYCFVEVEIRDTV